MDARETALDIARHKTAISRTDFSRPIKLALMDGILSSETRILDYGCGRGDDLRLLASIGIEGMGWDPVHLPDGVLVSAPVVNLGYVVNVVENPRERLETLKKAWSLAQEVLILSARLTLEERTLGLAGSLADGCVTSRGTFQKFYD